MALHTSSCMTSGSIFLVGDLIVSIRMQNNLFDAIILMRLQRSCSGKKSEGLVAAFVKETHTTAIATADVATEGFRSTGALAANHFVGLGRRSAITKHAGFLGRPDREWPILLHPNSTPSDLKFHPGHSMPVPYLEIPLSWNDQTVEDRKIIIGPCPHPTEAADSIEMLLKKEEISGVKITPSNIPYRDW